MWHRPLILPAFRALVNKPVTLLTFEVNPWFPFSDGKSLTFYQIYLSIGQATAIFAAMNYNRARREDLGHPKHVTNLFLFPK